MVAAPLFVQAQLFSGTSVDAATVEVLLSVDGGGNAFESIKVDGESADGAEESG